MLRKYYPRIKEATAIAISLYHVSARYDQATIITREGIKFRTGFILQSEHEEFREWSGITFFQNGSVLFVANTGVSLVATPIFDSQGNIYNFIMPFISTIKIGVDFIKNEFADIEEITYADGIGCFLSHEAINIGADNYISFFDSCDLGNSNNGILIKIPTEITKLPKNQGIEALAVLEDGMLLAIEEFGYDKVHHRIWMWSAQDHSNDQTRILLYKTDYYVGVSAATFLPDKSLLVAERKTIFSSNSEHKVDYEIIIYHIKTEELNNNSGYIVKKIPFIIFSNDGDTPGRFSENIEAMAIKTNLINIDLFILSDDQSLNRTVLLQFDISLYRMVQQEILYDNEYIY